MGRLHLCKLQEGLLVHKAPIIPFKGLSSAALGQVWKETSALTDCSSTCVLGAPAFGSQGCPIKDEQVITREVPESVFSIKKKSILDTFHLLKWKHYHPYFLLKNFGSTSWVFFFLPFAGMHLGMEMNVELVSLFQLSGV